MRGDNKPISLCLSVLGMRVSPTHSQDVLSIRFLAELRHDLSLRDLRTPQPLSLGHCS